ncbi:flagellar basal-body rod protein FlgC [Marivita lacus]|uniref:Flagellar basal-body rod protein FlgC n=1 Tax=Marivita lacus TaxID=1323742 RepID=A0ABQ1KWS1_9RHOB|nr:flagellar basal body rod protein FlgC [Marivita lacus]GGC09887.1 flagellar basal-body rod protein FlgC [Marivita lacus]
MDILSALGRTASSGLTAQSQRLQIIAENMANADSTGSTAGSDPYRRRVVTFGDMIDDSSGASLVSVRSVIEDQTPFRMRHDPFHPAADAEGYVKTPNVDPLLELANMREAARSYEANLNMMETGRKMRGQLLDMLG